MEPKTLEDIFDDLDDTELEAALGELPNDEPWSPLQALVVDPSQWCHFETLDFPNSASTPTPSNDSSIDTTSDRCSGIHVASCRSGEVVGTGLGAAAADTENGGKAPRKRKGKATVLPDNVEAPPDWLPDGWRVERRARSSGRTAGTVDRYYYDPERKRQFRSKSEVFRYLTMGIDGYKSQRESSSKKSGKRSGNTKPTKGDVELKEELDLDFDFADLPDWTVPSALEGEVHFIGDLKILKSAND